MDHEYVSFLVDWMMKFPHVVDSVGGHVSPSCDICCVVCVQYSVYEEAEMMSVKMNQ